MNYHFYDFVGNLGVLFILGTYFLLQLGRMSSSSISYTVLNGLGAAFILYSLLYEFNMSAFIVEVVWLLISLMGLARIYFERNLNSKKSHSKPASNDSATGNGMTETLKRLELDVPEAQSRQENSQGHGGNCN